MSGSAATPSPVRQCVIAGIFGATAGVFAKAAGNFNAFENIYLLTTTTVLLYLAMILCNWKSWGYYVRGMETLPSLQASVITSSTSSLSMGALAWLLFNETLTLKWMTGMAFMLCGVFIISSASSIQTKSNNLKED